MGKMNEREEKTTLFSNSILFIEMFNWFQTVREKNGNCFFQSL